MLKQDSKFLLNFRISVRINLPLFSIGAKTWYFLVLIPYFLEWKIVVGRRRFTSGHRTVGEEEEDRNYHGGTRWRTSWRAEAWKRIWRRIDIFGVWEWMDGPWLCRSYIYIYIYSPLTISLLKHMGSVLEINNRNDNFIIHSAFCAMFSFSCSHAKSRWSSIAKYPCFLSFPL